MTYRLTDEEREILRWQMLEDPDDYVARIEANFTNANEVIIEQLEYSRAEWAASNDKRARAVRDAEILQQLMPSQETQRLAQVRAYAEAKLLQQAAIELGYQDIARAIDAELTKIELLQQR